MFDGSKVIVVVPARNEAPRITAVLRGMPAFVDQIIVVDDASTDDTRARVESLHDARIIRVFLEKNRGVGGAIAAGYARALASPGGPRDAICVMAGDGQMDPDDLSRVVSPVAGGAAEYVKGDRLSSAREARAMPFARRVGGRVLSRLTSIAIARPIHDSQCGYSAIARATCAALDLDDLWPRYGYPNDLLGQLASIGARVCEVSVKSVYSANIPSGIGARHVPRIVLLIARAAWRARVCEGRVCEEALQASPNVTH